MAFTLAAAWFVGSRRATRRTLGFGLFILSNLLWTAWGWQADAYALIILQAGLFILNVRGAKRQDTVDSQENLARN